MDNYFTELNQVDVSGKIGEEKTGCLTCPGHGRGVS